MSASRRLRFGVMAPHESSTPPNPWTECFGTGEECHDAHRIGVLLSEEDVREIEIIERNRYRDEADTVALLEMLL